MSDPQVQIPFAGGPNESADPRQLPLGSVIAVSNAVYDADGSYQPRLGYTALAGASHNPAGCRSLYRFGETLLARDEPASTVPQLWAWDSQAGDWRAQDTLPPLQASWANLVNTSSTISAWDSATYQDYRVVAWVDSTDSLFRYAVFQISTGATVVPPTAIGGGISYTSVRVGIIGTTAIVAACRLLTARVDGWTIALSPVGAAAGPTQLDAGDAGGRTSFGSFELAFGATTCAVLYEHVITVSQSSVILRSFDATLSFQASSSWTPSGNSHGFVSFGAAFDASGNLWWGVFSTTSNYASSMLAFRSSSSTLAVSGGPFAMLPPSNVTKVTFATPSVCDRLVVCPISSTVALIAVTAHLGFSSLGASGGSRTWWATAWQTFNRSTGLIGSSNGASNCYLASTPTLDTNTGSVLALVLAGAVSATLVGTEMVAGVSTATPAQSIANAGTFVLSAFYESGAVLGSLDPWALVAPDISQQFSFSALLTALASKLSPTLTGYEVIAPIVRSGSRVGLSAISFTRSQALGLGASLGQELYVGGFYFDRTRVAEVGFAHPPLPFGQADNSGAPTNTFQYALTYARVDSAGNLEESAPFIHQLITSSATPNVTLTLPCLHLTRKQRAADAAAPGQFSPVYVLIYRTQALENGDNTLHLMTAVPYPSASASLLTSDVLSVTDTGLADTTLAQQPVLYTVSGELQHDAPEQLHGVVAHGGRIYGIGADNRTIWVSQTYSDGQLPAWSLSTLFQLQDQSETITALGSFQDKLCIFTATRVYVLYGDGPSPSGVGASWTFPIQRLPSVSGCTEPRSVVLTPMGLAFQSTRGLELVTPALAVEFWGQAVQVTTGGKICSAAVMADTDSVVRFCLTNSDVFASQTSGVLLAFDFRRERWTLHFPTASPAAATLGLPYAAARTLALGFVQAGNLDALGGANTASVARENTTADATPWLDFGAYFVPLSVTTAWIRSGDLQGWQRVRRIRALAAYNDAHGITLTLDYDYQTVGEAHVYTSNVIANLVSGSWEQVRITPGRGKSEALRVTLASTAPTSPQVLGSGRGAGFVGLAFEILAKQGGYRNLGAGAKS